MKDLLLHSVLITTQCCFYQRIAAQISDSKNQNQMDLTVFDRAVKSQFPEWKGFATTSLRSREQILANVYNLDLSSCSLSTVPQGIFECKF